MSRSTAFDLEEIIHKAMMLFWRQWVSTSTRAMSGRSQAGTPACKGGLFFLYSFLRKLEEVKEVAPELEPCKT